MSVDKSLKKKESLLNVIKHSKTSIYPCEAINNKAAHNLKLLTTGAYLPLEN